MTPLSGAGAGRAVAQAGPAGRRPAGRMCLRGRLRNRRILKQETTTPVGSHPLQQVTRGEGQGGQEVSRAAGVISPCRPRFLAPERPWNPDPDLLRFGPALTKEIACRTKTPAAGAVGVGPPGTRGATATPTVPSAG